MLQSLCFEYFAPKVLRTLELRVVVTHAISIACEDPRKVFQTLDLHVTITPDLSILCETAGKVQIPQEIQAKYSGQRT
jgi:hypothetical protein